MYPPAIANRSRLLENANEGAPPQRPREGHVATEAAFPQGPVLGMSRHLPLLSARRTYPWLVGTHGPSKAASNKGATRGNGCSPGQRRQLPLSSPKCIYGVSSKPCPSPDAKNSLWHPCPSSQTADLALVPHTCPELCVTHCLFPHLTSDSLSRSSPVPGSSSVKITTRS